MKLKFVTLLSTILSSSHSLQIDSQTCDCDTIKFSSQNPYILRKYEQALGLYNRVKGVEVGGRSVWLHGNENYFLYYSNASSMWAVGEVLGGSEATIENRGETDKCPDTVRSSWSVPSRLGDGQMYDETMVMICQTGACGGQYCGHQASCDQETGECRCEEGHTGDPAIRCFPVIGSLCNCKEITLKTSNQQSLRNQAESFGSYFLHSQSAGYPVYQHRHGALYLYQQDGSWLISNKVGSRAGGVQNQGDPSMCPYRFKTSWEYADVSRVGWQWSYDYSASMVCREDGCSVTKCGARATCTDLGGEGSCSCDIGFDGNPYTRCYPVEVPGDCSCTRLTVSSSGEAAATQSDKMGKYYLYGYHDGRVVYQHQSGLEYLFHAHGQAWAIGANVGGLRVGVINFSNTSCPYTGDAVWKYSTQGQLEDDPSLRVVCDTGSVVLNPIAPVTTTLKSSSLQNTGGENMYSRNDVIDTTTTSANQGTTETSGIISVATGDKGIIKVHQHLEERPTKIQDLKIRNEDKIPDTFFDQLSNNIYGEDQESGESYKIYLLSTTKSPLNENLNPNFFQTQSVRTPRTPSPKLRSPTQKIEQNFQPTILPTTSSRTTTQSLQYYLDQLSVKTKPSVKTQRVPEKQTLHPAYTSLPINYDRAEGKQIINEMMQKLDRYRFKPVAAVPEVLRPTTEAVIHHPEVTEAASLATRRQDKPHKFTPSERLDVASELGEELRPYRGPCNCSKLIMSSNNPVTLSKHGGELGQYSLVGGMAGRPVYRHVARPYYLFYQPESGGNWLVNNRPGQLYGGIQNSKDYPACPYLLSTVWQYGDSEVGGWVYDPSLSLTCPDSPCSVLQCGFRAECVKEGAQAQCACKPGFMGDPYTRCYPRVRQSRCGCNQIRVSTGGPASLHQRDKMGDYFLWGYYNDHPVYQHYSGLDFLYFHANQVWGVGPKVGGKKAGLLNFDAADCPYQINSPWQFGTKLPEKGRQLDTHLTVSCVTNH